MPHDHDHKHDRDPSHDHNKKSNPSRPGPKERELAVALTVAVLGAAKVEQPPGTLAHTTLEVYEALLAGLTRPSPDERDHRDA